MDLLSRAVNHTSLASASHDEAVDALRNARGQEISLAVVHYRSAAPFLLRNLPKQLVPDVEDAQSEPEQPTCGTSRRP